MRTAPLAREGERGRAMDIETFQGTQSREGCLVVMRVVQTHGGLTLMNACQGRDRKQTWVAERRDAVERAAVGAAAAVCTREIALNVRRSDM